MTNSLCQWALNVYVTGLPSKPASWAEVGSFAGLVVPYSLVSLLFSLVLAVPDETGAAGLLQFDLPMPLFHGQSFLLLAECFLCLPLCVHLSFSSSALYSNKGNNNPKLAWFSPTCWSEARRIRVPMGKGSRWVSDAPQSLPPSPSWGGKVTVSHIVGLVS